MRVVLEPAGVACCLLYKRKSSPFYCNRDVTMIKQMAHAHATGVRSPSRDATTRPLNGFG